MRRHLLTKIEVTSVSGELGSRPIRRSLMALGLMFGLLTGSDVTAEKSEAPPALANPPDTRDYFQLRGGLENCRRTFTREHRGRVVFLGGSITHMAGWRELVGQELERRFPSTEFDFIDAGVPSLGSVPDAFRFSRDVLSHGPVDLLFVDAAVNDEANGTSESDQIRAMEGIVRHARMGNPATDVVLLHFADPAKMRVIRDGRQPAVIANHEKVATYYRLPSIDLAREVTERISAGQFSWEKDFKGLHPAPFGHQVYARAIARLFDAAWRGPSAGPLDVSARPLPTALDPANYARGELVDVSRADAEAPWHLVEKWHPTDGAGLRDGFFDVPVLVGEQAGATLRFKFKGTAVGILVVSGPDAGIVEWQIDDGPLATLNLITRWSPTLHLPWAQVLAPAIRAGEHELTLRIAAAQDPRSRGHAVRIVHFLVNDE